MTKFKKTSKDLGHGNVTGFGDRKKRKRKLPFGTKPDDEYNSMISWNVARKEGMGRWKRKNVSEGDDDESRYVP